ncbi:tetratricopeptide repeat protein [Actomonas aquatica]|uniref:Tetratricopeptide repeat protein n=1 Tax=Actomonas aquatica TaxID=2866162 RepID=A0ABZ1C4Q0_9BACT|nr:hypothetical protein [Opitutus sp. WL0086]WRQ86357.1 hypothetical protein K1X11_016195 [Opitutus sp. WL0086]
MNKDAAAELQAVAAEDAGTEPVLTVWVALYHETRSWRKLVTVARELARVAPTNEQGWISWAYALRELEEVAEAQQVLREAEPQHGEGCAVLHYNLACYACLLGDLKEAWRRLLRAIDLDASFYESAQSDRDLEPLWDEIRELDEPF